MKQKFNEINLSTALGSCELHEVTSISWNLDLLTTHNQPMK